MLYDFSLLKSFFLACRLRLLRFAQSAFFNGSAQLRILSQKVCKGSAVNKKSPMLQHGAIVTVKNFYPA